MSIDLYKILGVEAGASTEEIRRAYRAKALQYHPDRNPDPEAADIFKTINTAYKVLSDHESRALYDGWVLNKVAAPAMRRHPADRRPRRGPTVVEEERYDWLTGLAGLAFCFLITVVGFVLLLLALQNLQGPLHNGRLSAFYAMLLIAGAFAWVGLAGIQRIIPRLSKT